jgi:hypothetical protein
VNLVWLLIGEATGFGLGATVACHIRDRLAGRSIFTPDFLGLHRRMLTKVRWAEMVAWLESCDVPINDVAADGHLVLDGDRLTVDLVRRDVYGQPIPNAAGDSFVTDRATFVVTTPPPNVRACLPLGSPVRYRSAP